MKGQDVPIGVRCREKEHEFHATKASIQLVVLKAGELVRGVGSAYIHLQGCHHYQCVSVVEKVLKNIIDWRFRRDQFLKLGDTKINNTASIII